LTLQELSVKMEVSKESIKKKISFWIMKGVLEEISTDKYQVIEVIKEDSHKRKSNNFSPKSSFHYPYKHFYQIIEPQYDLEVEEDVSAVESSQDKKEEEMKTYLSYITGSFF